MAKSPQTPDTSHLQKHASAQSTECRPATIPEGARGPAALPSPPAASHLSQSRSSAASLSDGGGARGRERVCSKATSACFGLEPLSAASSSASSTAAPSTPDAASRCRSSESLRCARASAASPAASPSAAGGEAGGSASSLGAATASTGAAAGAAASASSGTATPIGTSSPCEGAAACDAVASTAAESATRAGRAVPSCARGVGGAGGASGMWCGTSSAVRLTHAPCQLCPMTRSSSSIVPSSRRVAFSG
mmetsp:Transcript_1522/g.4650  ORF Transcript_1522/g.4650 Transcript_1522/m.4650 type:complete len:250 (-) Transcript_1522:435-1184(-)